MCCKEENHMSQAHGMAHCAPHMGTAHGKCGCGCGGRMFRSKKEKIEMLEEYNESLKNEIEGVEEELKALRVE
jgi:hypothetical protein